MKYFTLIILSLLLTGCHAQKEIDLKALIGDSKEHALEQFENWGMKISPDEMTGYEDGIQIEVENGKVSTIWIEFTDRRTGSFPFQVDNVVTPSVLIQKVIDAYGEPDVTGGGTETGGVNLGGWMKWVTKSYQLHCEIINSKVVMVTLMKPDWYPGK